MSHNLCDISRVEGNSVEIKCASYAFQFQLGDS